MSKATSVLALLLSLLTAAASAAPEDELLEPDKAFQLSTRVVDARTVEASWRIADGYYLYKDKFKFEALDKNIRVQSPIIPPGKKKDDPFFGTTETYFKTVTIRVPLERNDAAQTARLRITAQGCNEPIGVCYPPITKEVSMALPAMTAQAPVGDGATRREVRSLKDLAQIISPSDGQQEVVDPEQAFKVSVTGAERVLTARFDIADCCYLYRDKMRFEVTGQGVTLGKHTLPAGKKKTDEFFGTTEVYYRGLDVKLPVQTSGPPSAFTLKVSYQGCSEKGVTICYPPTTKSFQIAAAATGLTATPAATAQASAEVPASAETPSDHKPFVLAILAAFGAGLLLTFTPCVLPMIPILSSIIVGTGEKKITKWQGGLMSYAYVFGTAVTYTAAGIVAGKTGDQLQAQFQNPWAIGSFSVILVLLALSMFGLYTLQMPSFIQSLLQQHSEKLRSRRGTYIGLFLMGLISALIVGACVSPVLIGALGAAIAAKDPVLGGGIMFALAHGQGAILIAMGVGAGWLLPRAGGWMDHVKHAFGVLLIAVAIYLLGYLPNVPVLYLWAALLIATSIYLGVTVGAKKLATSWRYTWKGLETLLLVWGILALLGAFNGNRDIFDPLPTLGVASTTVDADTNTSRDTGNTSSLFQPVRSLAELDGRLAEAKAAGKPVLLDYYATWCTDCVRMEKSTFLDPRVRDIVSSRFIALQADVTDPNDAQSKAIKQRFGVYGPPAMLFFGADGSERRELRTYGYKKADDFVRMLEQL